MSKDSPGRNDPCPCGSGRKYKTCCLDADRKASRAGLGVLSAVAGSDDQGRGDEVWQAELVPLPASIASDPEARACAAVVVADTDPLWAEVHRRPSGEVQEVADLLAAAVRAAAEKWGRSPVRLEARHEEVVAALAERLAPESVEVVRRTTLPALDALATSMVGEEYPDGMGAGLARPCTSSVRTWGGWALPDDTVAELFAAAAAYHDSRPWAALHDDAHLELETAEGRVWTVSVLGAGGIERGLSLYSDPADRERILASPFIPLEPTGLFEGRSLCLTFEPVDELPPTMRREVLRSGWEVAAPSAYPFLFTINAPGGGISKADAQDLTLALRTVAAGGDHLVAAYREGTEAEWPDAGTGATLRLVALEGGPAVRAGEGHAALSGPLPDPRSADRFDELAAMLWEVAEVDELPPDLADEATDLLYDYALADPEGFLAGRKPEILVAAALHSAGMVLDTPWSGWRPTLEELAERFGCSTASISSRSRAIRDRVSRPDPWERMFITAAGWLDSLPDTPPDLFPELFEAVGFVPPTGAFDLGAIAELTDLADGDVRWLERALRRGMDRERERSGWMERDLRGLPERLTDDTAFGAGLREVLRADDVTPAARDALARWVVARLPFAAPPAFEPIPTSSLLAVSRLADQGVLRGEALADAAVLAIDVAPDAVEGLSAEDARPLVRALGADEALEPEDRIAILHQLFVDTTWGRNGRIGPELVTLVADEEAIPVDIRYDVLGYISGLFYPEPERAGTSPAVRRRALVGRIRLEEDPESLIEPLLDTGADTEVRGLAAAELLESLGAGLPRAEVERLVRSGLAADRAAVRRAFFRAGLALVGDEIREWAPEGLAGEPGGGGTDQLRLF